MRYAYIVLLPVVLAACQKVIDVRLDSSDARYIVSARLTDQPGGCLVSLTQSKAFDEDNQFAGVGGATVTIEHDGIVTMLKELSTGVFIDDTLTGKPAHTYQLSIHLGDARFTASSTMPQPVELDSIYTRTSALSDNKYVTVVYRDPPHTANYYHFIQYVNGKKEPSIFVSDDEFSDGLTVKSQLNYNNDTDDPARNIKDGDSVSIEMICNDAAVYQFWYSLSNGATGANNTASPANPVSNITGGAMGYFSVQTVRQRSLVVH